MVDYDDADLFETAMLLKKTLRVLNEHWNDPAYAEMNVPEVAEGLSDDEYEEIWDQRYEASDEIMQSIIDEQSSEV